MIMIVFIVLGILFLTAGVISFVIAMFKCEDIGNFTWGMCTMLVYLVGIIFLAESDRKPKAIDVYRGNTTLQITYTDSIPTDTVVIFKKK